MEEVKDLKEQLVLAVNNLAKVQNDPLLEFAALKVIADAIEERLKEVKVDAALAASIKLHDEDEPRDSGKFMYKGVWFELSLEEVLDFMKNPHKYANEAGAQYRKLYKEREALQASTKAKTNLMKAIKDNFLTDHPDWKPDAVKKVLKLSSAPANWDLAAPQATPQESQEEA